MVLRVFLNIYILLFVVECFGLVVQSVAHLTAVIKEHGELFT